MSNPLDALSVLLLEQANLEESRRRAIKRQQFREEQERIRRQRQREEQHRRAEEAEEQRRRQKWQELLELVEQEQREKAEAEKRSQLEIQRNAEKKRKEYRRYHQMYHRLLQHFDELVTEYSEAGYVFPNLTKTKRKCLSAAMQNWPEPYRSMCRYTMEETMCFCVDPVAAERGLYLLRFMPI